MGLKSGLYGGRNLSSAPLHYDEQTLQIHIIAEYARRGLASIDTAQSLAADYFTLERESFIDRWLAARTQAVSTQ